MPTPTSAPTLPPTPLVRTLLTVAWWSIVLGLLIEGALVIASLLVGGSPVLKNIVSDGLGKVSWSIAVCSGLAVGTAATKSRASFMGLMGLLSAPAAFTTARAIQKVVAQLLGAADPAAALPSVIAVSSVKGIEYLVLGALIGWIGKQTWGGAGAHAAIGASLGLIFGAAFVALAIGFGNPAPPVSKLTLLGVNELLFPIGCSLVLYAATAIGKVLPSA